METIEKIKHDWYQTDSMVVVEVRIKGCRSEDTKIEFEDKSLSVTTKIPGKSCEYNLEVILSHTIVPSQSIFRILSTKIEIKMKKFQGLYWKSLEDDRLGLLTDTCLDTSAQSLPSDSKKYPTSSGKDWNKLSKEIDDMAEEKLEGEQALSQMFQKIYTEGNDNLRRAMNKSFTESGGTVLSTDWNQIGKKKVDVHPPDGMEYKKWNE